MAVLEVHHLKKIYTTRLGGARVQALTDVNFSVEKGEYVAIMGESGSGKTTLLNILASLDRPSSGEVLLNGTRLSAIPESRLAAWRREKLGFVVGGEIKVVSVMGGNLIVQVKEARVAISKEMALKIMV